MWGEKRREKSVVAPKLLFEQVEGQDIEKTMGKVC